HLLYLSFRKTAIHIFLFFSKFLSRSLRKHYGLSYVKVNDIIFEWRVLLSDKCSKSFRQSTEIGILLLLRAMHNNLSPWPLWGFTPLYDLQNTLFFEHV
ncbi:hypothetical protein ACJX0J_018138, partial [Zea mays]